MTKRVLKRILLLIPTVIGVSFIVFLLFYLSPGDAALAKAGPNAPKEVIEALREKMGLNDPFLAQYLRFLKGLLFKFDLGNSYISGSNVTKTLLAVFPNTLKLTGFSLLIAVFFGILLGVLSAVKRGTFVDKLVMIISMVGIAMPIFWTGILLILLFSVKLRWLPPSGFSSFKAMLMPAFALGLQSSAIIMRMTRSSMLEVLNQDYIETANAKGLKKQKIIFVHALKNAMIPIITTIGLQAGGLLGGSVLTETVFSIPGIGRLMVESIKTRDLPVVLGGVILISICYSLISIIVDILYGFIDPRIGRS